MAANERLKELPARHAAIQLGVRTYALIAVRAFRGRASLRDQIKQAAVSVSNNITEGFERGTTQELLTFLYVARGSAGEPRSIRCLLERLGSFADLRSEISDLKSKAEAISRQLRGWADSLQNSRVPGQRYLTEAANGGERKPGKRTEFLRYSRRNLAPASGE